MTALPDGMERRYLSNRAQVAHVVDLFAARTISGLYSGSKCGIWPGTEGWRGTGNQTERERAAALPLCATCDRLIFGRGDHGGE